MNVDADILLPLFMTKIYCEFQKLKLRTLTHTAIYLKRYRYNYT